MTFGNYTFGVGAIIALITGIIVLVLYVSDEFTLKAAALAIMALAVARLVP
jgi:cytochrome b subunit of formate dehydrogenase